jgi:hypothetical protein
VAIMDDAMRIEMRMTITNYRINGEERGVRRQETGDTCHSGFGRRKTNAGE